LTLRSHLNKNLKIMKFLHLLLLIISCDFDLTIGNKKCNQMVNIGQRTEKKVDKLLKGDFPWTCLIGWKYSSESNRCYKSFTMENYISWQDAQNECRKYRGDLAVIHNENINSIVSTLASIGLLPLPAWIGGFRQDIPEFWIPEGLPENQFTWVDGSKLDFLSFGAGQPAFKTGREFCLIINFQNQLGVWADAICRNQTEIRDFVCQI